jgi:hypothetical protein
LLECARQADEAERNLPAVDEAAHIIVAAELTDSASDAAELPRMLQAVQNQTSSCIEDRDGGGSWSEIKEERAARGKAGDIRGMSRPHPGPGRATTFCRPDS